MKTKESINLKTKELINLKYTLAFCLSLYFIMGVSAQNIAPDSTTSVETERTFGKDNMEAYKNNAAYIYEKDPRLSTNPIKAWWQSSLRKINNFIEEATSPELWKIIRFLFIIGVILLIVYHISHSDRSGILSKKDISISNAEVRFETGELLVPEINRMIKDFESKGAYRTAIRWYYLKTIQNLNKGGYVEWNEKMSNVQLLSQIKEPPKKDVFSELIKIYEYTWYGKHDLSSLPIYNKLKSKFDHFNQTLSSTI